MRPDVPPVVIRLNGPAGEPALIQTINMARPPSQDVATLAQKRVVDTMKRMQDTVDDAFGFADYGVTEISGQFWNEWYAQNKDYDIVTQRVVFAL